MKHMKKLCTLALAVMLMAVFSVAASAAEVKTGGLLYEYDPAAGEVWQSFTGDWTYDENGISVANDGSDVWFYTYMGIDEGWTDYVIELDMVNVAEGGVIFRCTDPAPGVDSFGGYIIAYDSAYCFVGMDDNDNWKTLPDDGPDAPAAAAMNYTAQMHWKIIVQGNTFTLYVDDIPIPFVQVQDESYTQGGIGLRAKVFEGDDSGYFTNIKVYELKDGSAPLLEIPGIERGEVLYEYDPATAEEEWSAFTGTWTYDENGINVVNDGNDVWYYSFVGTDQGWTDYIMELDLVNLPEAGVVFRCVDCGPTIDSFDGYYLGYDSAYAIIGMDDGTDTWELLREDGPDAPAAAVLNYAAKMHWTIVVQGDKYTLYVDDLPLPYIQVQDDTHMEGGIGVRGKFLPDDTPGYFQNIKVYELKTAGGAPAADPDPAPDTPEPAETEPDPVEDAPAPTEAPPASAGSSGSSVWIWVVAIVILAAAAAAVVIVIRKKNDTK